MLIAFENFECLESLFLEMFESEIFKTFKIITYIITSVHEIEN